MRNKLNISPSKKESDTPVTVDSRLEETTASGFAREYESTEKMINKGPNSHPVTTMINEEDVQENVAHNSKLLLPVTPDKDKNTHPGNPGQQARFNHMMQNRTSVTSKYFK